MATTLHFDFRVKVRRNFKDDRWFATSEQIPLYVMADSREQLKERIDRTMDVFCRHIEERYTIQEIEEYLRIRGVNHKKVTSPEESQDPALLGRAMLELTGAH